MSRSRRLRRLVPDEALFDRRVAGEPLRALALEYKVVHSTLVRYFRKPEAVVELREARRRLHAEGKAGRASERLLQQEIRRRARDDEEFDRKLEALGRPQPLRGLHSRDRYSQSDDEAEKVVAAGWGVEQIIDATPLRGRTDILRNIDRQIVVRALDNDAKSPANARPDDSGLRRLAPTSELIRRRASRETLRSLAADYGVSHTTLSRYFKRAVVAKQVVAEQQAQDRYHRPTRSGDHS